VLEQLNNLHHHKIKSKDQLKAEMQMMLLF